MKTAVERPVGEIIGRQPATYLVTPSKARPAWYGTIEGGEKTGFGGHSITGGLRFTNEQARECISRGLDVLTAPALTVRRHPSMDEIWCGAHQAKPVYQFECPIIRRMADGRVRVIAPSGVEKLVEADGWTSPDRKRTLSRRMAA